MLLWPSHFEYHSGQCCGIREMTFVPDGSNYDVTAANRSFIYKVKFSPEDKEAFVELLKQFQRNAAPLTKAVILGNCCWVTPQPAATRSRNHRFRSAVYFTRSFTHRQLTTLYYATNDSRWGNNWNETPYTEVALITKQSTQFHGDLIQRGFVQPLSSVNPNTGRKINLYLKGPVEHVQFE
jgi:hypothetical protein